MHSSPILLRVSSDCAGFDRDINNIRLGSNYIYGINMAIHLSIRGGGLFLRENKGIRGKYSELYAVVVYLKSPREFPGIHVQSDYTSFGLVITHG